MSQRKLRMIIYNSLYMLSKLEDLPISDFSTHKICQDGECSNAHSTKSSCCGNISIQFSDNASVSPSGKI